MNNNLGSSSYLSSDWLLNMVTESEVTMQLVISTLELTIIMVCPRTGIRRQGVAVPNGKLLGSADLVMGYSNSARSIIMPACVV